MRLMGALLLVVAFAACGISVASRMRECNRNAERMLAFLRALERELRFGRAPLPIWLESYRDPLLESEGLLPLLRADPQKHWERGIAALSLPEDARPVLLSFGQTLGRLPLDTQLARLAQCVSALEELLGALRKKEVASARSTVSLWTLAGLLLALLLL